MSNNNTNNEIPSIITTAHLLLRGLIPAFLGCSIGDDESEKNNGGSADKCRASAFQMTFRSCAVPDQSASDYFCTEFGERLPAPAVLPAEEVRSESR